MEEMELYSYDLHRKCRIYIYKEGNGYSADIYWPCGTITGCSDLCATDPDNLLGMCKDHIDMTKEEV